MGNSERKIKKELNTVGRGLVLTILPRQTYTLLEGLEIHNPSDVIVKITVYNPNLNKKEKRDD